MEYLGLDVFFKGKNLQRLIEGLLVALHISIVAIIISIFAGIILGIIMTSKNKFIQFITNLYLNFIRIMPQLVLLFIFYFGITRVFNINLSSTIASIIVFSLWGIAEMSDLVRGAITSISKHQYDSSFALGLNLIQTYKYIIIPQAIRRLIPLSINLITRMIKTTSLVLMIGVVEVVKVSQQIIEANRKTSPNASFGIYLIILILYFISCYPISRLSKYLEKIWSD